MQIERLVPCQYSAYQLALCRLIEGEVEASESATATKTLKKINNTLMELRTISNHPLIRSTHLSPVCLIFSATVYKPSVVHWSALESVHCILTNATLHCYPIALCQMPYCTVPKLFH